MTSEKTGSEPTIEQRVFVRNLRYEYRQHEEAGYLPETPELICARLLAARDAKAEASARELENWTPTAENINALPAPLLQFIHDLETRADPAGEVRELHCARDNAAALANRVRELEAERDHFKRELRESKEQALDLRATNERLGWRVQELTRKETP